MSEAEQIASQHTSKAQGYDNAPGTTWVTAENEIQSLLIKVQRLVKSLGDAYWEMLTQGDQKRQLLLYQKMLVKPHLFNNALKYYDEQGRTEIATEFINRTKLWIKEVEELL